jgi:hypothetical protein
MMIAATMIAHWGAGASDTDLCAAFILRINRQQVN